MDHQTNLIEQAKSGCMRAFQEIVETYSHKSFAVAYRILNDQGHAEDCVQEVFIKIHKNLKTFDRRSKFTTWLYSVSANCAIDMQRKLNRHRNGDDEGLDQLPEQINNDPEKLYKHQNLLKSTQRALSQLSEEVRVAFVLRHFEDKSIEEISQILSVNPNTVKNRIFRGVGRLREIMKPHIGLDESTQSRQRNPKKGE